MTAPGSDRVISKGGFENFRHYLSENGRLSPIEKKERTQKVPIRHTPDRPNVLWLMADQLRADTFGFMNHPFIQTPNLDKLAREGAFCRRSYCSSPVCMPARATFLTGDYLARHGVIANGYRMNAEEPVFPGKVREAGWRTANIGKVHSGRGAGETWEYHEGVKDAFGATKPSDVPFDPENYPELTFLGYEPVDNSDAVLHGVYPGPVKTTKSYVMATQAMKWLYWHDDPRPFFLRVSFDDPHPPIVPPEPFAGMYDPDSIPLDFLDGFRESLANKPQVVREWAEYSKKTMITEEDHRKHAARYCGLVSHLDAQFGRILDYLDELGIADNTIVIMNSDHGNMIGEHGLTHKGSILFEGVSRIPTVFRWPGRIKAGTVVDSVVDNVDFVPTVFDMLGLDIDEYLPGKSIFPVLEGKEEKVRDYAFIQWYDYGFAVVGKKFKLAWWDSDEDGELYDLETDPYEKVNLFNDGSYAETRNELLGILNEWREEHAQGLSALWQKK